MRELAKKIVHYGDMKDKVKKGESYLGDIVRGGFGKYVELVFAEQLNVTPRQLGLGDKVDESMLDEKNVNYLELIDLYNIKVTEIDPIGTCQGKIEDLENEIRKIVKRDVYIDVNEEDGAIGVYIK